MKPWIAFLLFGGVTLFVIGASLELAQWRADGLQRELVAMEESLVAEMDPTALPAPAPKPLNPLPVSGAKKVRVPVKVPILVYHSVKPLEVGETLIQRTYQVEPAIFERQIRYLSEQGYSPITPDDMASYFRAGRDLPSKPVMVTFDDGWENQYEYARPILEKYKIRATFYVFTNPIGRDKRFMTWDQLRQLLAEGMTIGSHTRSHPYLTRLADEKALIDEIDGSKKRLEEELGVTVNSFCYPFGLRDQRVEDLVRQAGFTTARGLRNYVVFDQPDLLNLGGFIITDNFSRFQRILEEGK